MSTIDISGLEHVRVLAALFNNARHDGRAAQDTRGRHIMVPSEAAKLFDELRAVDPNATRARVEYLFGRGILVDFDLRNELIGVDDYDRLYGRGAGERVIGALRANGGCGPIEPAAEQDHQ